MKNTTKVIDIHIKNLPAQAWRVARANSNIRGIADSGVGGSGYLRKVGTTR